MLSFYDLLSVIPSDAMLSVWDADSDCEYCFSKRDLYDVFEETKLRKKRALLARPSYNMVADNLVPQLRIIICKCQN